MRGRPATGSMMRNELRRPEHAAELAEARREIGDADRAAVAVGQHGGDDRGVAQIFGLILRHVVEHDVGESLLLVARQQAAEDRIAVEARKAPPHDPRRRIDQRRRAAVADDGKIEPVVVSFMPAPSAVVAPTICASQRAHVLAAVEMTVDAGERSRPTEKPGRRIAAMTREHRLVGDVVADEDRMPVGERRVLHQFAHRERLAEAAPA